MIMANAVKLGNQAGAIGQRDFAVAVGYAAGQNNQGTYSISIGTFAGQTNQLENSIAIGNGSGSSSQSQYSIALGNDTGHIGQGTRAVAVGPQAGYVTQGVNAVAVGNMAGNASQGISSVAVGDSAGYANMKKYAIGVGYRAGYQAMGTNSIAIGMNAGYTNMGNNSIAIGAYAGMTNTSNNSIVINATGSTLSNNSSNSLTIAPIANNTGSNVLAYNTSTKEVSYMPNTIANISDVTFTSLTASQILEYDGTKWVNATPSAGVTQLSQLGDVTFGALAQYQTLQYNGTKWANNNNLELGNNRILFTNDMIKIGADAGYTLQGVSTVAIGGASGYYSQGNYCIAIGLNAGFTGQSAGSIALGLYAGSYNMGNDSIAIGNNAGNTGMGVNCIAIGGYAGQTNQDSNTIILNATGVGFSTGGTYRFYVDPIRNDTSTNLQSLAYNTSTKEITYGATASAAKDYATISLYGYITSGCFNSTSTERNFLVLASGPSNFWQSGNPTTYPSTTALTINTSLGKITGMTISKKYMVDITSYLTLSGGSGDFSLYLRDDAGVKTRCLRQSPSDFSSAIIMTNTTTCYFTIASDAGGANPGGIVDLLNVRFTVVEI
jgi:hypothetical protein